MLKSKITLILTLIISFMHGQEEYVRVGIMHKEKIYSANFTVQRGTYKVYADYNYITSIKKTEKLSLQYGDSLKIRVRGKLVTAKRVQLKGTDYVNHFVLKVPGKKQEAYDDDLEFRPNKYGIQFINAVHIENYVSAVIEGEAGYAKPVEFYKLQAILSRTYVLKNEHRHQHEGFNVCDKVHCQVYHHKCTKPQIYETTIATKSLVVVDEKLNLINTLFHSNCGGQTCNSEDVWNQKFSYLRCVKDSFCLNSRSSLWEKRMPKTQLNNYFKRKNPKGVYDDIFRFCQVEERHEENRLLSVKLTKIRKDLKLRSTFFYIEDEGDSAVFYGRGYGHGVGLCQQGGIEMAKQNYSYVDILKKYYKGINIINRNALRFFTEN